MKRLFLSSSSSLSPEKKYRRKVQVGRQKDGKHTQDGSQKHCLPEAAKALKHNGPKKLPKIQSGKRDHKRPA